MVKISLPILIPHFVQDRLHGIGRPESIEKYGFVDQKWGKPYFVLRVHQVESKREIYMESPFLSLPCVHVAQN